MSHIFISYSRKDKHVVAQFVEALRQQDFIVWQDVSDIPAGAPWHQALLDAITASSAVIVFWSQAASLSTYVNEEIDHAFKQNKLIIPVWLDKNTPLRSDLSAINAVDSAGFSTTALQLTGLRLRLIGRYGPSHRSDCFNTLMGMRLRLIWHHHYDRPTHQTRFNPLTGLRLRLIRFVGFLAGVVAMQFQSPDGDVLFSEKFAPMGCAVCFPF